MKGKVAVTQVAAVAALVAPILGSVLYTAFGLKPVLYAVVPARAAKCNIGSGGSRLVKSEGLW